jgi:glycosyltransferase involved in cell wall biosynthesis
LFSVVIPLYNKEKYISQTVQSVLDQSFKEFELLIVNDGSTDNSIEMTKSFTDERIRLISIDNSGVSVARNTGIDKAKYDWIAFLDADDWWDRHFLEEINNAILKYPNNAIFSSGRSRVFKDYTERYEHEHLPDVGATGIVNYFQIISKYLPPSNASNTVIRKSKLFEKGYFRERQANHEDHDLWMRLTLDENVVFINKNLSFYRKDIEESASDRYYEASDFITYMKTINEVKNNVSKFDLDYFKKYYNRFILYTYIKNYGNYSRDEDEMVYKLAKDILDGKHLFILKALKLFPFKNTYKILRQLN